MTDRESLMAAFEEFRDALMAHDTDSLDRLLASDYRSYNLRGEFEGREVVLEAYGPGGSILDRWEVEDLQVDLFSEVGIITGKGFVAGRWEGQPWSHHLRFCDVWVIRNGRWQTLISQATTVEGIPTGLSEVGLK